MLSLSIGLLPRYCSGIEQYRSMFNIEQYTIALEFCSDAAGALKTFSNLYHPSSSYIMENDKKNLALKIVQMKERLFSWHRE